MHGGVVRGRQQSIASHVNPDVITMIIAEKIEARFGKTRTVTRDKEHVFLGMNVRYTDELTAVVVTMKEEYLREAISDSGMDIVREAATPARRASLK